MQDLATIAAQAWATAHAASRRDAAGFGRDVALVAAACELTQQHSSDPKFTAAALALLSIPPEELQDLLQFAQRLFPVLASYCQVVQAGEKS